MSSMFEDFDILAALPDDDSAHAASAINTALSPEALGAGVEIGEMGLGAFDDASSVTVDTSFQPKIPSAASFDARLIFEIALGFESPKEIYSRYNITDAQWWAVSKQPAFKRAVIEKQNEIAEEGVSYRLKARTQAEAYLKDVHILIKHPMTSPSVKLEAIKYITKVSDLEPKPNKDDTGTTFNLQINL